MNKASHDHNRAATEIKQEVPGISENLNLEKEIGEFAGFLSILQNTLSFNTPMFDYLFSDFWKMWKFICFETKIKEYCRKGRVLDWIRVKKTIRNM